MVYALAVCLACACVGIGAAEFDWGDVEAHVIGRMPEGLPLDQEDDDSSNKIFEGYAAKRNEFPFVAYLEKNGTIQCTGSLIDRRWLLTTSRCTDFKPTDVVLGHYDRKVVGDTEQVIKVSDIIYPEEFVDAALVRLASPANIKSEAVATVDLVDTAGFMRKAIANEKTCVQLGWGYTFRRGEWVLPRRLRAIDVNFVNATELIRRGYGLYLSFWQFGTEAIYKDKCESGGTCFADEGGPVVCRKGKNWVLTGMFSFFTAWDGCMTGPKATQSVFEVYDWIQSVISR